MKNKKPIVGIIMGSKSDWKDVMEHCSEMFKEFYLMRTRFDPFIMHIISRMNIQNESDYHRS